MAKVERSIDIGVPVFAAYTQWTQFEQFPHFMEGVHEVRRLDNRRLHWKADIEGMTKEWDAEIAEQTPGRKLSWRSTSGEKLAEQVSFLRIDPGHTRVTLMLEADTVGAAEQPGSVPAVMSTRVQGDLRRFKEFVEARILEKGVWRSDTRNGQIKPTSPSSANRSGNSQPGTTHGPYKSTSGSNAPRGSLPDDDRMNGDQISSGSPQLPGRHSRNLRGQSNTSD